MHWLISILYKDFSRLFVRRLKGRRGRQCSFSNHTARRRYPRRDKVVESQLMIQCYSIRNSSMIWFPVVVSFSFASNDLWLIAESLCVEVSLHKVRS